MYISYRLLNTSYHLLNANYYLLNVISYQQLKGVIEPENATKIA